MSDYPVTDFGAVADGSCDDAAAIQRAIDKAHQAGGGRVLIPQGCSVRAGTFFLKSGIDFHVADQAVLLSATDIAAFPRTVFGVGEESDKRFWIGGHHAEKITLSGTGTIDGQCHAFALGEDEYIFKPTLKWRPAMTFFEDISGITVRDLTLRNSANWTLHFTGCRDVHVHDVTIRNDLKFPNADGIDPDHCKRVRIERCHIVAADDCIVLKNTEAFARYGSCEDIEISDCRLESVSSAFKVGSESHGDFRRIRMHDCVIERSNRGIAFQMRDSGSLEDAEFRNIRIHTRRFAPVFWGAGEAIYITLLPRRSDTVPGWIRNVRFQGIDCRGENGVLVYSDPPDRIEGLRFEDVTVAVERETEWPSGMFDLRPFQGDYRPHQAEPWGEVTPWGYPARRPPALFSLDGATGVQFHRVRVEPPVNDSVAWLPLASDRPMETGEGWTVIRG